MCASIDRHHLRGNQTPSRRADSTGTESWFFFAHLFGSFGHWLRGHDHSAKRARSRRHKSIAQLHHQQVPALVEACRRISPSEARLPRRRFLGQFDAVIGGITQQVGQALRAFPERLADQPGLSPLITPGGTIFARLTPRSRTSARLTVSIGEQRAATPARCHCAAPRGRLPAELSELGGLPANMCRLRCENCFSSALLHIGAWASLQPGADAKRRAAIPERLRRFCAKPAGLRIASWSPRPAPAVISTAGGALARCAPRRRHRLGCRQPHAMA